MKKINASTMGDQGIKGALIGIYSYVTVKLGLDVEAVAAFTPLVMIIINWLSTKIGDPTVASFLAKKPAK
jgi:hypothetical protein